MAYDRPPMAEKEFLTQMALGLFKQVGHYRLPDNRLVVSGFFKGQGMESFLIIEEEDK